MPAVIAVLGAGPAGLAAAWRAAVGGHDVVVLERAAAVGGMSASFTVAGVAVDHGSHRLHPSIAPEILAALRALLGDDLQVRERNGRIRLAGRWVAFPLRPLDMARNLPGSFVGRAVVEALGSPLRRPRTDTFAEEVRARLGPTVAREFYEPYVQKLWDTSPHDLAGELARRRVSARSPVDVVRRALRREASPTRQFLYPRRGYGQIAEALAAAAVDAGAELRLDAEITGLRPTAGQLEVALASGAVVEAGQVWSTLPLSALARMASPTGEPAEAGAGLRHRAVVLVYLVLDRPRYTPFDAHYFPEPDVALARLSEPKNYRESGDDPSEVTVVCAEVPCWEGDERWSAPDEELGALVAGDLVRSGLPEPAPVEIVIRRLPRVYPIYRPGFEADLATLERWATRTGVVTFGRQGLFVPDNTHHALAMGWAAAGALGSGGDFDWTAWRRARDGFRSHVVED